MANDTIVDNEVKHRFELEEDGHVAELDYHVNGNRLVLIHTGVPEALGGRGLGGKLVQAALERARAQNMVVRPECEFARGWIEKHPDALTGVTVDISGL